MDFKTKRGYRKKSLIYSYLGYIFLIGFAVLMIVGILKDNYHFYMYSFITFLFGVFILKLSFKCLNKRTKYLNDIKL